MFVLLCLDHFIDQNAFCFYSFLCQMARFRPCTEGECFSMVSVPRFLSNALLPCLLFLVMPIMRWDAQECRHLSQTDSVFLYTCLSKVVGSYDSCLMFLRNFCTYPTKAIIYIKTTVCEVLHMPTPSLALSFIFLVTAILIDIGEYFTVLKFVLSRLLQIKSFFVFMYFLAIYVSALRKMLWYTFIQN